MHLGLCKAVSRAVRVKGLLRLVPVSHCNMLPGLYRLGPWHELWQVQSKTKNTLPSTRLTSI